MCTKLAMAKRQLDVAGTPAIIDLRARSEPEADCASGCTKITTFFNH
jgi:hypothetical protein